MTGIGIGNLTFCYRDVNINKPGGSLSRTRHTEHTISSSKESHHPKLLD